MMMMVPTRRMTMVVLMWTESFFGVEQGAIDESRLSCFGLFDLKPS